MQPHESSRFAVVCMARETPEVLRRFIDHYDRLGAAEIFVIFDGPETSELTALNAKTQLNLRFVDLDYWQGMLGDEALVFERRLTHAFSVAQASAMSPWLLVTDADEFLIARTPVAEMLARIPADIEAFSIPTAEAVWGPGDDLMQPYGSTWFRRPLYRRRQRILLDPILYGRSAHFFDGNVLGHKSGKYFLRTAVHFDRLGSHEAYRKGRSVTASFRDRPSLAAGNEMAHFDAISFARWQEKFRRRYSGELAAVEMRGPRSAQMAEIAKVFRGADRVEPAQGLALFRRFYQIGRLQAAIMKRLGLAFRLSMFPS